MVRAFSLAPIDAGGVMNPDGQFGITLHVDTGTLNDPASGEGGVIGNCNNGLDGDGDGNPDQLDPEWPAMAENLGVQTSCLVQSISRLDGRLYALKAANFDPVPLRVPLRRHRSAGVPRSTLSEDSGPAGSCFANGADGTTDGGDTDCQGDPALDERGGANSCSNGLDDDGDGAIDGADGYTRLRNVSPKDTGSGA